jgi:hypothetical protein
MADTTQPDAPVLATAAPQLNGLGSAPDPGPAPGPLSMPDSSYTGMPQGPQPTVTRAPLNPLQQVGYAIKDNMGTPVDTVNDQGQLIENMVSATPGTIFKKLLAGALTGLGASASHHGGGLLGNVGVGFDAETKAVEEQRDEIRNKAIQQAQLKQQTQKNSDEHSTATMEQAVHAATVTHLNAATAQATAETAKLTQENRDAVYATNKAFRDQTIADGGQIIPGGSGISLKDAMAKLADDPTLGHTATYRAVGEHPALDAQGNPILGADGKPQMQEEFDIFKLPANHSLPASEIAQYAKYGLMNKDVTPGQTISGASWADLQRKLQGKQMDELKLQETNATIGDLGAKTAASNAEAGKYAQEALLAKAQRDMIAGGGGNGIPAGGTTGNAQADDILSRYPVAIQTQARNLANDMTVDPKSFPTRTAKGSGQMDQATANGVAKLINPSYDATNFDNYKKLRADFTGNGQDARQIQSFNTFVQHAGDLLSINRQLQNTDITLLNIPINKLKRAAGATNVAAVQPAIEAVRTEYQKMIGGGFALTESDKQAGKVLFDENSTLGQMEGAIKGMLTTGGIRLATTHDKWTSVTHRDYDGLMSPSTHDILWNASNGTDSGSQGLKQVLNSPSLLPHANGQQIDPAVATRFLNAAGGDKDKARQLATQNGWKF